jgi:hypothetical protein
MHFVKLILLIFIIYIAIYTFIHKLDDEYDGLRFRNIVRNVCVPVNNGQDTVLQKVHSFLEETEPYYNIGNGVSVNLPSITQNGTVIQGITATSTYVPFSESILAELEKKYYLHNKQKPKLLQPGW